MTTRYEPIVLGRDIETDDEYCDCVHSAAVMDAREYISNAGSLSAMSEIFALLGDPTRLRVLTALRAGELCVTDLAVATGVNRSTVSHQLRVLRSRNLVTRRREGKVVYYAVANDRLEALLELMSRPPGVSRGDGA